MNETQSTAQQPGNNESKRQQTGVNRAERRASQSKAKGRTQHTKHRGIGRAK